MASARRERTFQLLNQVIGAPAAAGPGVGYLRPISPNIR